MVLIVIKPLSLKKKQKLLFSNGLLKTAMLHFAFIYSIWFYLSLLKYNLTLCHWIWLQWGHPPALLELMKAWVAAAAGQSSGIMWHRWSRWKLIQESCPNLTITALPVGEREGEKERERTCCKGGVDGWFLTFSSFLLLHSQNTSILHSHGLQTIILSLSLSSLLLAPSILSTLDFQMDGSV